MPTAVDLRYRGVAELIAAYIIDTGSGLLIIDPGPAITLDTLLASVDLSRVEALLLTHIHLDHAGAAGAIVRMFPQVRVFVHERGAPHMADPTKLLASANRLYGGRVTELWGDTEPVPAENITTLHGGEQLRFGHTAVDVTYAPGHAYHHVVYHHDGDLYAGDAAGIKVPSVPYVLPYTPPPEIDLEAWEGTFERMRAFRPKRMFLTHFGPVDDISAHVDAFHQNLSEWVKLAGRTTSEDFAAAFEDRVSGELSHIGNLEHCWLGLSRYLRSKTNAHR